MKQIDQEFAEKIKETIRDIPDFPKKGILFRDITTLLQDGTLYSKVTDVLENYCAERNAEAIAGIESRGFIFGGALSDRMKIPFIPVRKEGKLPYDTVNTFYSLEYGEASIEIHRDALKEGQRIIIIDDLLATGGTAAATAELIEKCGGEVAGIAFMVELAFLNGREKIDKYDIYSLVQYED